MAGSDQDKPFKPTRRSLREARKRGEVARSGDVTSSAALVAAALVGGTELPWVVSNIRRLIDRALATVDQPSTAGITALGRASAWTALEICVAFVAPVAFIAVMATFAYSGPVFSLTPMGFKLERLNPAQAWTQFMRPERLVELGKSGAKVLVFAVVAGALLLEETRRVGVLAAAGPTGLLTQLGGAVTRLLTAAIVVSLAAAIADGVYQRRAYFKKQHMTREEHRRSQREQSGDPRLKKQRRRLHQEWLRNAAVEAARGAAVLVTNPTHLSVAIAYDPQEHEAPIVSAKGEDHVAMEMREAAQAAGVPMVRNIVLARDLYERTDVEEFVPEDLFTAVAEVIVWARQVRLAEPQPPGDLA